MRATRALAVVLLAGCFVSGCGSGGPKIPDENLGRLVLHAADLPRSFAPFYNGPQAKIDVTGPARSDPTRFGRKGGWVARFHRGGGRGTPGPLVVVSSVDVFGSSGNANDDLDAYKADFDRQAAVATRTLHPPRIGDETVGVTYVQPGPLAIRFFTIAWRYRNATAAVTAEGFGNRIRLGDALKLARRQQRRLAGS